MKIFVLNYFCKLYLDANLETVIWIGQARLMCYYIITYMRFFQPQEIDVPVTLVNYKVLCIIV